MARRSDHSPDELTAMVLEHTRTLVDEFGPDKVTARRIAQEIGYTPGTLYSHFANLGDIFLHVNAANLRELRKDLQDRVVGITDPQRAIEALGLGYLEFAQTHPHRFSLMYTSHLPQGEDAPAHLQKSIDGLFALVETQVLKVRPDLAGEPLEVCVRALWSGVHGAVSLSIADQLFTRRWQADRRILCELIEQFLCGLKAGRGS